MLTAKSNKAAWVSLTVFCNGSSKRITELIALQQVETTIYGTRLFSSEASLTLILKDWHKSHGQVKVNFSEVASFTAAGGETTKGLINEGNTSTDNYVRQKLTSMTIAFDATSPQVQMVHTQVLTVLY